MASVLGPDPNVHNGISEDLARRLYQLEVTKRQPNKPTFETDLLQNCEDCNANLDYYKSVFVKYGPRTNFSKVNRHEQKFLQPYAFEVPYLLDYYTRKLFMKLQTSGVISEFTAIMSIRDDAFFLHAITGAGEKCVVKVYTSAYMYKYKMEALKLTDHQKRVALRFCAEEEALNLGRLAQLGVPCPRVIHQRKHVLMLSFIGVDGVGAPTLAEAQLTAFDYARAYQQVVDCIAKSYKKYKVCHGNLNEDNILWHQDKCYFISVLQSVTPDNPEAFHFLLKGTTAMHNFFKEKEVPNLATPEELFRNLVGFEHTDSFQLSHIHKAHTIKTPNIHKKKCIPTKL